jgi:hypothetical protein
MISAFCWAFRDTPDATLILKMVHENYDAYRYFLFLMLSRLEPFRCRVIAIQTSLDSGEYEQLIAATSYFVDTAEYKALCLPLMEFMSFGRPAITPCHTAMEDYIDTDTAFIVKSSRQLGTRPLDWKMMLRAERYRLNWESLLEAYRESYRVAKVEPERYAALSRAAQERIRDVASDDAVAAQLRSFLAANEFGQPRKSAGNDVTTYDISPSRWTSGRVSNTQPRSTTVQETNP